MNWKDIVKSVAPVLGTALGGPLGGTAVKFIAEKVLGDSSADESTVAEFIASASPDKLLELKALDQDFKIQMKQLDVDVFALEQKDRDSARALFKINIWPQIVLSALYIVGYFIVLVAVLTGKVAIPESSQSLVNVLIGMLSTAVPMILQFWFGSSMGSKEKTAKM